MESEFPKYQNITNGSILHRGSLQTTIIVNFVLLAVVPLIIFGIITATRATSELESDAAARSLTLAQTSAAEIDAFLGHSETVLRQAAMVTGTRYYQHQAQLEEFLNALIKAGSPLDSIYILNRSGTIILSATLGPERLKGFSMRGQPFFQKARGTEKIFWASPFIDLKTMKMTLPACLSFNGGMVVGYVNLSLLQSITQRIHRGGRGFAFITDQTGVVIAHPDENAVFQRVNESRLDIVRSGLEGRSGTLIYEDAGEKFIGSVTHVAKTGWSVIVTQPTAEAFALSIKMRRLLWIGCGVTLVLALCLALWNSRRIPRPLLYLAGDTRRVAGGDYAFTPSLNHPYKELNALAHDFFLMTKAMRDREEALRKAYAELEQRVQERTAELARANDYLKTEIAERKQAEELYKALAENSLSAVFIVQDKIFRYINTSAIAYAGYNAEESIGADSYIIVHPDDKEMVKNKAREIMQNRSTTPYEYRMVTKQGQIRWIMQIISPILYDGRPAILGNAIDVTEHKLAEEALQKANAELESFSYSVSHDLRAPLRGIDGWSLALLEDCADKLDEQGRKYLEFVRMETQRMECLIDGLLELSRVTRAEMQRGRVDISAIAHSIASRLKEAEPDRQVDFVIQQGLIAYGDARLIDVMMTNLFGNAWKFTSKHPFARIEFGRTEIKDQIVYFVRDDGVGFDMAYAGKLFGAFQRMHKTSEFPGSGIGLATVQRIVHRHSGRIWAEAEVEKGATFYFTL